MVPETSTAAREIAIDKLLYLGKIRRWRENLMLKYGLPPISHLNCIVQRWLNDLDGGSPAPLTIETG